MAWRTFAVKPAEEEEPDQWKTFESKAPEPEEEETGVIAGIKRGLKTAYEKLTPEDEPQPEIAGEVTRIPAAAPAAPGQAPAGSEFMAAPGALGEPMLKEDLQARPVTPFEQAYQAEVGAIEGEDELETELRVNREDEDAGEIPAEPQVDKDGRIIIEKDSEPWRWENAKKDIKAWTAARKEKEKRHQVNINNAKKSILAKDPSYEFAEGQGPWVEDPRELHERRGGYGQWDPKNPRDLSGEDEAGFVNQFASRLVPGGYTGAKRYEQGLYTMNYYLWLDADTRQKAGLDSVVDQIAKGAFPDDTQKQEAYKVRFGQEASDLWGSGHLADDLIFAEAEKHGVMLKERPQDILTWSQPPANIDELRKKSANRIEKVDKDIKQFYKDNPDYALPEDWEDLTAEEQELKYGGTFWGEQLSTNAINSLLSIGTYLSVQTATKNATLATLTAGMVLYPQFVKEISDELKNLEQTEGIVVPDEIKAELSLLMAMPSSMIEGLSERLGFGPGITGHFKKIGVKAMRRELIKRFVQSSLTKKAVALARPTLWTVKQAGAGYMEEAGQQVVSNAATQFVGSERSLFQGVHEAGRIGAVLEPMLGGPAAATTHGYGKFQERKAKKEVEKKISAAQEQIDRILKDTPDQTAEDLLSDEDLAPAAERETEFIGPESVEAEETAEEFTEEELEAARALEAEPARALEVEPAKPAKPARPVPAAAEKATEQIARIWAGKKPPAPGGIIEQISAAPTPKAPGPGKVRITPTSKRKMFQSLADEMGETAGAKIRFDSVIYQDERPVGLQMTVTDGPAKGARFTISDRAHKTRAEAQRFVDSVIKAYSIKPAPAPAVKPAPVAAAPVLTEKEKGYEDIAKIIKGIGKKTPQQEYDALVAGLTPEQKASVLDLIKDPEMEIGEKLGLLRADLATLEIELAAKKKAPPKEEIVIPEKPPAKVEPGEKLEPVSEVPAPPPGDRWTADRGAIPGEPLYFLDQSPEGPDDSQAAIIEHEVEDGSLFELVDPDGRSLGMFKDPGSAATAAEEMFEEPPAKAPPEKPAVPPPPAPPPPAPTPPELVGGPRVAPIRTEPPIPIPAPAPAPAPAPTPTEAPGPSVTDIVTPKNPEGYEARYELIEADKLVASHSPETWQRHADYPEGVQERAYHTDKAEQAKVIENAQKLDPRILLSDDPTPTSGPPIVTEGDYVISGNSRAMSIELAFKDPKKLTRYKNQLIAKASKFGLAPKAIRTMDKPVLIRRIQTKDDEQMRALAREFNETMTAGMGEAAEIASMGKSISPETMEKIGIRLADREISLRELLGKKDGLDIIGWLIKDGAISASQKNRFMNADATLLNKTGKETIESAIFGNIIDDLDLINSAQKAHLNKIERTLAQLAKVKSRGGAWDITPDLKEGLRLATAAQAQDLSVRDLLAQQPLFGEAPQYSDTAKGLADLIIKDKPKQFADRWKAYSIDAIADSRTQAQMFKPKSQAESLKEHFDIEAGPPAAPAAEVKAEPAEADHYPERNDNKHYPTGSQVVGQLPIAIYFESEERLQEAMKMGSYKELARFTLDQITDPEAWTEIDKKLDIYGPNDLRIIRLEGKNEYVLQGKKRPEKPAAAVVGRGAEVVRNIEAGNLDALDGFDLKDLVEAAQSLGIGATGKKGALVDRLRKEGPEAVLAEKPKKELKPAAEQLKRIMSGKVPVTEAELDKLTMEYLKSLAVSMGFPTTGNKETLIAKILDLKKLRDELKGYGEDYQVLVDKYGKPELKAMVARTKGWKSGNKMQLAQVLLNWRDRTMHKGKQEIRKALEAAGKPIPDEFKTPFELEQEGKAPEPAEEPAGEIEERGKVTNVMGAEMRLDATNEAGGVVVQMWRNTGKTPDTRDKSAAVRMVDRDSGNTIDIKAFPSYPDAIMDFLEKRNDNIKAEPPTRPDDARTEAIGILAGKLKQAEAKGFEFYFPEDAPREMTADDRMELVGAVSGGYADRLILEKDVIPLMPEAPAVEAPPLSKANRLRKIKGDVQDRLKELGFKVSVTDTPELVFFTDKPINDKSVKHENQYITSFGEKGALAFLEGPEAEAPAAPAEAADLDALRKDLETTGAGRLLGVDFSIQQLEADPRAFYYQYVIEGKRFEHGNWNRETAINQAVIKAEEIQIARGAPEAVAETAISYLHSEDAKSKAENAFSEQTLNLPIKRTQSDKYAAGMRLDDADKPVEILLSEKFDMTPAQRTFLIAHEMTHAERAFKGRPFKKDATISEWNELPYEQSAQRAAKHISGIEVDPGDLPIRKAAEGLSNKELTERDYPVGTTVRFKTGFDKRLKQIEEIDNDGNVLVTGSTVFRSPLEFEIYTAPAEAPAAAPAAIAPAPAEKAAPEHEKTAGSTKLANWINTKLVKDESISWRDLFKQADTDFEGTQAQGVYTPKDAYDAMEQGVNIYIHDQMTMRDPEDAAANVAWLKDTIAKLPTQTKRTREQGEFQQFSTPPPLAYVANWVANIQKNDAYLEPSAGVGGLAIFGREAVGDNITVNELDPRRASILGELGFKTVYVEDASQLDNILPDDVKPTVIVMNPPFSATAGRIKGARATKFGAQQIEQALARLEDGGRLVAIVGKGMGEQEPGFTSWWKIIKSKYTVLANVRTSGKEYKKYGTTFDNQLIIIDKIGPTDYNIVKGKVEKIEDLIPKLEGVRNDRQTMGKPGEEREPIAGEPAGEAITETERPEAGLERPGGPAVGTVGGKPGEIGYEPDIAGGIPGTERIDTEPGEPISESEIDERDRGEREGAGERPGGRAGPGAIGAPGGVSPAASGELSLDELSSMIDDVFEEEKPAEKKAPPKNFDEALAAGLIKKEGAPTKSEKEDGYAQIANIISNIPKTTEAKEQATTYGTTQPLVHPDAYDQAKPILDRMFLEFIDNPNQWIRDAKKHLGKYNIEPAIIKNWLMYYYANDRPATPDPVEYDNPIDQVRLSQETVEGKNILPEWEYGIWYDRYEKHAAGLERDYGTKINIWHRAPFQIQDMIQKDARFLDAALANDELQTGENDDLAALGNRLLRNEGQHIPARFEFENAIVWGNAFEVISLRKFDKGSKGKSLWGDLVAVHPLAYDDPIGSWASPYMMKADSPMMIRRTTRNELKGILKQGGFTMQTLPAGRWWRLANIIESIENNDEKAPAYRYLMDVTGLDEKGLYRAYRNGDIALIERLGKEGKLAPFKKVPGVTKYKGPRAPGDKAVKKPTKPEIEKAEKKREEITANLYEKYTGALTGATKHPSPLVETAALADTDLPELTYKVDLPKIVLKPKKAGDGISDIQLEFVTMAGQAHDRHNPDGTRMGAYAGHGTGVGKGRLISAIILDNWRKGRKKAIWITEKGPLETDAKRDLNSTGWPEGAKALFNLNKTKLGGPIKKHDTGIMFTTYSTLASKFDKIDTKKPESFKDLKVRLNQIVEWVGSDFDGVIAFDESHNMGNSRAQQGARGKTTPAQKALAGILLQDLLPDARIVYVSATGATEVANMAYLSRLGLWGEGTPFASVTQFINSVSGAGLGMMEMVARDLKAQGLYTAPSLSYDGVDYDRLEHKLTPEQTEIYNTIARAWQVIMKNTEAALQITNGNMSGQQKQAAHSKLWGTQQRVFNQIITSMSLPTMLGSMDKALAKGDAIVIQLVNTNDAQQQRALADKKEDEDIEDLDFTPRASIATYLQNAFPVTQFEIRTDSEGKQYAVIVRDEDGNEVENREAVAMREQMLRDLGALKIPDSPLDQLLWHFGPDKVAEITGRKSRIILDEKTGLKKVQKWSKAKGLKDVDAFTDDKKQILVFSEAGGTGASYHADRNFKNQRKRRHYLLQPGWRADKAVQGMGRSHRTNQAQEPSYDLVTTNLKAQKRFISSIARRLDQLGALSRGQRQAGSQGIFQARDNLESEYAETALNRFYNQLVDGKIEGLSVESFEDQTGTQIVDEHGKMRQDLPTILRTMNRMLSMEVDQQNITFNAFSKNLDEVIQEHADAGTLDLGIETITGLAVEKVSEKVVRKDQDTGAETKYVQVKITNPAMKVAWEDVAGQPVYQNKRSGGVWAASATRQRTTADGAIVNYVILQSPTSTTQRQDISTLEDAEKWTALDNKAAANEWNTAYANIPDTADRTIDLMTGSLLPIWDRLTGFATVYRLQTDDGERLIGRVLHPKDVDTVLKRLGVQAEKVEVKNNRLGAKILAGGRATLANGWELKKSMVSGDERIELIGPGHQEIDLLEKQGAIIEEISWKTRIFIPTKGSGKVFDRILQNRPVTKLVSGYQGPRIADTELSEASTAFATKIKTEIDKGEKITQVDLFQGTAFEKKEPLPEPTQLVRAESTGKMGFESHVIANVADAAAFAAPLADMAQEKAFMISTDNEGNILEVHFMSKGTRGATSVGIVETIGRLFNTPGVTKAYFVHNHPSQLLSQDFQPSDDDVHIALGMRELSAAGGVDMEFLVIGGDRYLQFNPLGTKPTIIKVEEIRKTTRKIKIPIVERFIKRTGRPSKLVTNSEVAKKHIKNVYGDRQGFLLLNTKLEDLSFLEFTPGTPASKLVRDLIAEGERVNASVFVFNSKSETTEIPASRLEFLFEWQTQLGEGALQMMELIHNGVSYADAGKLPKANYLGNLDSLLSDNPVFASKKIAPTTAQTVEEVQLIADAVTAQWAKGGPAIKIYRTQEGLQQNVKDYLVAENRAADLITGAYYDNTIFLVAENLESPEETVLTILHEGFGHHGIRGTLGQKIYPVLRDLYIAKRKDIDVIGSELGFNMKTVEGQARAAEEWFANQAQLGIKSKWYDRLVAAIRGWIRSLGISIKFSDPEIRALIAAARQYALTGKRVTAHPGDMAAFKKKKYGKDIDYQGILPAEVERRRQAAKGVGKRTFVEKTKEHIETLKAERAHFPALEKIEDQKLRVQLADILRIHQEIPENARALTAEVMRGFIKDLSTDAYEIYTINILLADMMRDIETGLINNQMLREGETLPFGFESVEDIENAFAKFQRLTEVHPEIGEALRARKEYIDGMVSQLVKFKILKKEVMKHKDYYHHQVLQYWGTKDKARELQPDPRTLGSTGAPGSRPEKDPCLIITPSILRPNLWPYRNSSGSWKPQKP